jgi:hypothetical protein
MACARLFQSILSSTRSDPQGYDGHNSPWIVTATEFSIWMSGVEIGWGDQANIQWTVFVRRGNTEGSLARWSGGESQS